MKNAHLNFLCCKNWLSPSTQQCFVLLCHGIRRLLIKYNIWWQAFWFQNYTNLQCSSTVTTLPFFVYALISQFFQIHFFLSVLFFCVTYQFFQFNFQMNSMDELNAAREVILRRPIFTTVKCRKPYSTNVSAEDSSVSYMEHEFAVLVNTGNAEINSQFARAFELAEKYLNEGKNFRVTVCFIYCIYDYSMFQSWQVKYT